MVTYDKQEYKLLKENIRKTLLNEIGHCENCGYKKFTQILHVAHIRHGHDLESLRLSNVFLLCENCHTEFDRGLIKVKGILSDSQFSHRVTEISKQNNQQVWKKEKSGEYRIAK